MKSWLLINNQSSVSHRKGVACMYSDCYTPTILTTESFCKIIVAILICYLFSYLYLPVILSSYTLLADLILLGYLNTNFDSDQLSMKTFFWKFPLGRTAPITTMTKEDILSSKLFAWKEKNTISVISISNCLNHTSKPQKHLLLHFLLD